MEGWDYDRMLNSVDDKYHGMTEDRKAEDSGTASLGVGLPHTMSVGQYGGRWGSAAHHLY